MRPKPPTKRDRCLVAIFHMTQAIYELARIPTCRSGRAAERRRYTARYSISAALQAIDAAIREDRPPRGLRGGSVGVPHTPSNAGDVGQTHYEGDSCPSDHAT